MKNAICSEYIGCIYLKKLHFKKIVLFIIFISVTNGEFFTIFRLQQQIYIFSSFDWTFFSKLTVAGNKPVTHLTI